jgi:hypothetical protein
MVDSINGVDVASSGIEQAPDREVLEGVIADSVERSLIAAPIENKPILFGMYARTKAAEAAAARQRTIDDCWHVACAAGLIPLIGTTYVQGWISSAFRGDVS